MIIEEIAIRRKISQDKHPNRLPKGYMSFVTHRRSKLTSFFFWVLNFMCEGRCSNTIHLSMQNAGLNFIFIIFMEMSKKIGISLYACIDLPLSEMCIPVSCSWMFSNLQFLDSTGWKDPHLLLSFIVVFQLCCFLFCFLHIFNRDKTHDFSWQNICRITMI